MQSSGIEQLIVGINKMDGADYSEERYNEIKDTVSSMLKATGYKVKKIPLILVQSYKVKISIEYQN